MMGGQVVNPFGRCSNYPKISSPIDTKKGFGFWKHVSFNGFKYVFNFGYGNFRGSLGLGIMQVYHGGEAWKS